MNMTITTTKVTAGASRQAVATVTEYRENGNGSNRTKWERVTAVLSAVLTVIETGLPVEITDLFTETDAKAPAYHLAHRILSAGVVRPEWANVQVVTMRTGTITTGKGGTITGETTTTGKVGTVRVFITPVS